MNEKTDITYDLCLSFAGEDREYVRAVAKELSIHGVRIFFDEDEQVRLWGTDLYETLDHVYRKASRFCILFISSAYAAKAWTTHERRSAQARALEEHSEYLLPVRFDDTELPGLRPTIAYIDARRTSSQELANLLFAKLGIGWEVSLARLCADLLPLVQQYLAEADPQVFEPIAAKVVATFKACPVPVQEDWKVWGEYVKADSADRRILAYLCLQARPRGATDPFLRDEVIGAVDVETAYAEATRETRPLWQALSALAIFATVVNQEVAFSARTGLSPVLDRLDQRADIDPGGECKAKLRLLCHTYPWLR
jgi:hypothetical protein